ncbi:30S ribosomal protein THX [Joostella sp. CR20]
MGKGDKKSKRGKINRGSYGVKRRRKIKKQPPIEERISVDTKK